MPDTRRESTSDDGDDSEYYSDDPDITLASIEWSKTINFSIRANYTNWAPREAFRELVQNWRDGIIRSFHLAERDFHVVREEKTSDRDTEIVYRVPRPGSDDAKESLGYVRFKGGRGGSGTIAITNRSAMLQPWHLDLGGTSKAGDAHQAGAHGEGLKVALLVLMRGFQNHSVKCRSGGFNWIFNFTTRGRLVARLRRMSPEAIHKAKDKAWRERERTLLPVAADPNSDVQFFIGERHAGARNEWGDKVPRRPVKPADFDAWTKAALFLHDGAQDAIVPTEDGDILTDPQLCGHIYLKGLLLCASTPTRSASITNYPLKFGYNFAFGRTNRERQSVSGADEEARAILAIWSKVLMAKPEMVTELSAMLNTTEPQYADVVGAKRHTNFETARRLKEYLFGEQFAGKWYYSIEEKNLNPRLDHIIQGLGCEGAELTKPYWDILRRHNLIRTAEEEEHRRFTAAPPVAAAELESAFAISVRRLLCACVRACAKTDGIAVNFVQAGQLHLQLFYSEADRLFRVHERWLSLRGAIEELGLSDDLMEADVVFHTVKRLFADALEQLPREVFVEEDDSRTAEWRRKLEVSLAEQRLLNYQRIGELKVETLPEHPGLRLSWDVDSRRKPDTVVEIQCHRASQCSYLRDTLLTAADVRRDKMACISQRDGDDSRQGSDNAGLADPQIRTCWHYQSTYGTGSHHEYYLEEGEEYFFVLVTPADPGSFVRVSSITSAARPIPSPPLSLVVSSPPPMSLEPEPLRPRADSLPAASLSSADTDHEEDGSDSDYEEDGAETNHEEHDADADDEDMENSVIASSTGVSSAPSPTPEPARVNGVGQPAETRSAAREPAAADRLSLATMVNRVEQPAETRFAASEPAAAADRPSLATMVNKVEQPAETRSAAREPAAAGPPPPAPATVQAGSFVLGRRLRTLDIFTIDRDRWYEGSTTGDVRAVIGILAGEEVLPEETRKRPRME